MIRFPFVFHLNCYHALCLTSDSRPRSQYRMSYRIKFSIDLACQERSNAESEIGITYLNGTTARPGSNSKPAYSFPLAEVTALDYLYGGLSDSSLRLYCESVFLEASAQFQVPVATVTATSTVAGSLIPYTFVSTDYAASITPKPPCCADCTVSGNPAQLRYFPVTESAISNGSITVSDNFT